VTLSATIQPGQRISATRNRPRREHLGVLAADHLLDPPRVGSRFGGSSLSISGTDFSNPTTITIGGADAAAAIRRRPHADGDLSFLRPRDLPRRRRHDHRRNDGTLVNGWVADFLDVPGGHQFYAFVTTLVSNTITVGVGGGNYGVDQSTLRAADGGLHPEGQARALLHAAPVHGVFGDVPCSSSFAPWIEAMAAEGITGGCGGGNFCPTNPVRRDQMAVFLLKGEHGSSYAPPPCGRSIRRRSRCPSAFADWIEQLAAEQITGGCGGGNYCPSSISTRGQMAVFIVRRFHLQ
jgi:hypothetical protein